MDSAIRNRSCPPHCRVLIRFHRCPASPLPSISVSLHLWPSSGLTIKCAHLLASSQPVAHSRGWETHTAVEGQGPPGLKKKSCKMENVLCPNYKDLYLYVWRVITGISEASAVKLILLMRENVKASRLFLQFLFDSYNTKYILVVHYFL